VEKYDFKIIFLGGEKAPTIMLGKFVVISGKTE